MIEQVIKGAAVGVQRLDEPDELDNSWRLVIIDGQVVGGQIVPGSGSGMLISLFMGDEAAKAIHDSLEEASSGVVLPAKPKLVRPRTAARKR